MERIVPILTKDVAEVWPEVKPILARVVTPDTGFSLDDVLASLQLNDSRLWVIGDFKAVAVTIVLARPRNKVMWTQYIAGDDLDSWLSDWVDVQEDFAKHNGCEYVDFAGRKGWTKKVCQHYPGYKAVSTVYRKVLKD